MFPLGSGAGSDTVRGSGTGCRSGGGCVSNSTEADASADADADAAAVMLYLFKRPSGRSVVVFVVAPVDVSRGRTDVSLALSVVGGMVTKVAGCFLEIKPVVPKTQNTLSEVES